MRESVHFLILAATFFTIVVSPLNESKLPYRTSLNTRCDSGKAAPLTNYKDSISLQQLLVQFKGKFVFIDLWASWCTPCLDEFNKYKTQYSSLQKNNVILLCISIDTDSSDLKWKTFIKQNNLPGIHLRANKQLKDEITILIWNAVDVYSIPHHLLFDNTGKLINKNASILALADELKKNR